MKKFLKILGISIISFVAVLYISFLLILPNVVDLNSYKPLVQQLVKEQAMLDVDFTNAKISTTPLLHAGIIVEGLSVDLPDKSNFVSTDKIKIRISLPHLLLLTVKVSTAEVISPVLNLDIQNGQQFKVVKLVEDIVNAQKEDFSKIKTANKEQAFDASIIKIVVPALTIKDYRLSINDPKNSQNMSLKGDVLKLGYFNGKKVKVDVNAQVLVDDKEKISANVLLNTFIPVMSPTLDEEDDDIQRLEIPFINPIDIYKTYDLKADIDADIKVRNTKKGLLITGFSSIENISMTLSGYKLPESFVKLVFGGRKVFVDTDLYVNPNARLATTGQVGFGKRPFVDLSFITSKIHYNDLIVFAKAVLDTFCIPNNLEDISGKGYFVVESVIKTNFKKWKSSGSVLVKDGGIYDKKVGFLVKDANVDISLDNDIFKINEASSLINGAPIYAHGQIDNKAFADLTLYTNGLPLKGIYDALAPSVLKKQFALNSGVLTLNAQLSGELKKARAVANVGLKNFDFSERKNAFKLSNEDLDIKIDTTFPALEGSVVNKNLKFVLPQTNSSLYFPLVVIGMDEKNIEIVRSGLRLNNSSIINFHGNVSDYLTTPQIDFVADGKINSQDLKILAGKDVSPFIDAKGVMPLYLTAKGNMKKLVLLTQLMTDSNNYFTPITFNNLKGKQNIFQAHIDYKGNRLKIKDTGLYSKEAYSPFVNDMEANIVDAKQVISVDATITGIGSVPYINLFKFIIPKEMKGDIYALKNSEFTLDKTMLFAFGDALQPKIRGIFRIFGLSIPDLFITMEEAYADMRERRIDFVVNNLLVNGSDFKINGDVDLNELPLLVLPSLNVISNNIDVAKLNDVALAAAKIMPPTTPSASKPATSADIPVWLKNGNINFKKIDAAPIVAQNTTGRISLRNNLFKLDNLKTTSMGGVINGNVSMNLLNSLLAVKVNGKNFDVEKALYTLANMKDTLAGTASFKTDITMNAAAPNQIEQMRSLYGTVDFNIIDGQLGPFGRIENLILAENIRESKFFQTTLGGIINSIATIESSHFQNLDGHLEFANGIVNINPITTVGKVLCVHIAGAFDLIENTADMKLRARMGSQFSNLLGPLAALNPINLVKVTPGLNVMAAQAFQFFCESVSQAEMDALPNFVEEFSDLSTTKFQVVIRGDVAKPLTLIKSFKWLALDSDIEAAQNFVSTLPDPSIMPDAENATYEEIMQMKAQIEAQHAKEDAKLINKAKRILNIEYKYSDEL